MTISAIPPARQRAARSDKTARLMVEAAHEDAGDRRKQLINEVIELNIEVAHAIARRYRNRSVPLEDLQQVACMALVRAAHKFDHASGNDFLTYAVPTISGEIKRYFRDHGWTIRPPRRVQENQSRVIRAWRDSEHADAVPDTAKIAEELDLPETDVVEALRAQGCFTPSSLDQPVRMGDGGDQTLGDRFVTTDETEHEAIETRMTVLPAVRHLKPRDQRIVHMRFYENKTQAEIGEALGITQMQTSRVLKRILRDLKHDLEPQLPPAA